MTKRCYITTPVFKEIIENEKVSDDKKSELKRLWEILERSADLKISISRFPSEKEMEKVITEWKPHVIGCHLSHEITKTMVQKSNVVAICTSTAGYNHINKYPGILITHTPGVLHQTVADFTISLIMSNLRNIVSLHNFVWNEKWIPGQKWDLDENLSATIDSKIIGIIGLGEIGKELARRLSPWGVKILYYDIERRKEFENEIKNLVFVQNLEHIFSNSDILSIHIPLNDKTKHLIGRKYLKLMKKNSLLVNTARGAIINFSDLLNLLENEEIEINLAFDVYEDEPIKPDVLGRFKRVSKLKEKLRFIFIPHNASADANTRAQMAIMLLNDIVTIINSNSKEDIQGISLIPEQRILLKENGVNNLLKKFRIMDLWD